MRVATFSLPLLLLVWAARAYPSCNWTAPDGTQFDLSGLKSDQDYDGNDGMYGYKMNICQASQMVDCASEGGSLCQYTMGEDTLVAVVAAWTQSSALTYSLLDQNNATAGVTLTYNNGDICFIDGVQIAREATVNLHCTTVRSETFKIQEDQLTCHFTVDLDAGPAACPMPPPECSSLEDTHSCAATPDLQQRCVWCTSSLIGASCYSMPDAAALPVAFTCDWPKCAAYGNQTICDESKEDGPAGEACTWCTRLHNTGQSTAVPGCVNTTTAKELPSSVFECDNR